MGPTPYWSVAAIFANAAAHWTYIDGSIALAGGPDPLDLNIDRFCNVVVTWMREHLDEEGWQRFETIMSTPPPNATRAPASSEDGGFAGYAGALAGVST